MTCCRGEWETAYACLCAYALSYPDNTPPMTTRATRHDSERKETV